MAADKARPNNAPGLSGWPEPLEFALKNGLRVLFAPREKSPLIEFRLVLTGGFSADIEHRKGLAALATAVFSEGVLTAGGVRLGSVLDGLGALAHARVMPDAAIIGISALNANFDEALDIFVNALINLEFTSEDFEILRANQLARIADERLDPFQLALRVLPLSVYGKGHVYASPFTGSGSETDVAAITGDDVRGYYAKHLNSQCTTIVVAGLSDRADLQARLEQTFGDWPSAPASVLPTLPAQTAQHEASVVIVNHPSASQGFVAAAVGTFARNSKHAEPLMVLDALLGGMFTSRLNLSLRERKGWTYGVRSTLLDGSVQGLWVIRTAVRMDRTMEAMAEIASDIQDLAGRRPPTVEEFSRAVDYLAARIPANVETCAQVADALSDLIVHRLPASYMQTLANNFRHLTTHDVTETCNEIVAAGDLRWMVVGEAAEMNDRLRDAGVEKIQVVDRNSA
ncbi:MAG: insulinase family protein [Deltaproteobacteria bacterium]|nr:insulinase family protein [Deltaproteobacteria bacterium]